MTEVCHRGLGEILIPEWCIKCEKNNIFKRHCDTTRELVKESREIEENMIRVWTDGSCNVISKKKAGGWAYLIKFTTKDGGAKEITEIGSAFGTTVNQMELMAILSAIRKINKFEDRRTNVVTVYSDSEWAVRCITKVFNCRARVIKSYLDEIEWTTGDLIITYEHISGHAGILENELVDGLAVGVRVRMEHDAKLRRK